MGRRLGVVDPYTLISICVAASIFISLFATIGIPRWWYHRGGFELQRRSAFAAAPMCKARHTHSPWRLEEPLWSVPARLRQARQAAVALRPRQQTALYKVSLCRVLMHIY